MSENKQTNPSQAGRTGEIEIEQILLLDRYDQDFDITLMVAEINLYGDMSTPFHTASIIINDNQGMLFGMPVNGEETILISLKSSSFQTTETISKAYRVISVNNILLTAEGATATYEFQLVSLAGYINNLSRMRKKHTGNCTQVVVDIVDEYLHKPYVEMVRTMPEEVRQTSQMFENFFNYNHRPAINDISFVASNWTPGYAINWVSARAIGSTPDDMGNESAGFVFTEGFRDLHYQTLEEMFYVGRIKASPFYDSFGSIWRFHYFPASTSQNPMRNYQSIISFSPTRYMNHYDAQKRGVLASEVQTYDVLTKRYRRQQFDWVERHKEHARLEDYMDHGGIHTPSSGRYSFLFSPNTPRAYETASFKAVTHNQVFNNFKGYEPERVAQQRNFQFAVLRQMTMEVAIYGRLDAEQGSVIHLTLPLNTPDTDQAAEYISGYYIVLAVRHKITLSEHFTYLEVAKDSTRMDLT